MKPSSRRRVEREIKAIMEARGDNCSVCGKPLSHNCRTFGGVTAAGTAALAGACCKGQIKEVVLSGLYVNRHLDAFPVVTEDSTNEVLSAPQISKAIEGMHQYFAEIDKLGSNIARRGGAPPSRQANVSIAGTPWKRDDAEWFNQNALRSHRLRRVFPGEDATLFGGHKPTPPPNHEFQVLIRQIEPGKRMRMPFCRNLEVPIPDIEAILHAIFDLTNSGTEGIISSQKVAELATSYANANDKSRKTN